MYAFLCIYICQTSQASCKLQLYHAQEGMHLRGSDCKPTGHDVTGLSTIGYYGFRHTAARLLWSLIGNQPLCIIVSTSSATVAS